MSLSKEQISSNTKIDVRKITALENDAFDQLPTGIYLDGIAAVCAREVGLDVGAFLRRLRTHVAPVSPETLEQIAAARQGVTPRPLRDAGGLSVAHSMVAFAAVAMVLAIAGVGVRLYPVPSVIEPREATITGTVAQREPAAGSGRGSGPPPVMEAAPAEFASPQVVADLEPTPAPTNGVERREASPQRTAPVADQGAIHSVPAPARQTPAASMRPRPTLTGVWTLETEIESTSLRAFEGLRLGYRLDLRQNGDRIEGTGQKVTENGIALSGARRTAITVHGTLGEGRMRLTFGEQGARRSTTGTLDLVIDENGVLRGVFASEAARSAGAVEARRL